MRYLKFLLVVISSLFLLGCAANVKYSMNDKNLYVKQEPLKYHVAVDILEDVRPVEEQDGTISKVSGITVMCTKNKNFKPAINKQISSMLVEHLNKAKIFELTELKDVDNNLELNPQEMDMLKSEGIDLVILGKVNHFYGYQSYTAATSAAALFGLIGVFTEAIANPKEVGGNVEYADIKIIQLNNHGILWKGNISHNFAEKDIFYDGQIIYSLRALKEANNKFAIKLTEIIPERLEYEEQSN